ncbi:MAG: flagellar motor protein MotB [Spirochaetes bacterium]|nr:flagellar motor protein MotB [Spirochaetota bacterium]
MAEKKKRRKKSDGLAFDPNAWMATYGDMVTLLLCFFVIMFSPDDIQITRLQEVAVHFQQGGGLRPGGNTASPGRMADLGNRITALPAMERGFAMGTAVRRATSVFAPEIRSEIIKVTHDERGLVITLASDAFFEPASSRINLEETRGILLRLGTFLASSELQGRNFRIEGHADSVPVDPLGPWDDNWHLSAERSRSVLRYLTNLGVDERRFQIAGFSDTRPVATNATPEGRALNRRVDIIILDDGHL